MDTFYILETIEKDGEPREIVTIPASTLTAFLNRTPQLVCLRGILSDEVYVNMDATVLKSAHIE